ncbi:MAG: aromatic amino acid transport family protein [Legionellaceae bacterium]|nr:aromatic amino acid transport family protein [Legionellaceae bacterium]
MSSVRMPSVMGGILLVVGNVIGAGILALPIATAQLGLPMALLVLVLFWFLLLMGAFYSLEANMALPAGANLVSMAQASLGRVGVGVAWSCNLLVMYSLIAAYIAGGGDLIQVNLARMGLEGSTSLASILFLLFFGGLVTLGIARVDYMNRLLMLLKAGIFVCVIIGLMPHLTLSHVLWSPVQVPSSSLLIIIITSYGFATIVPSLRSYYHSDVKKIKSIMLKGMVISLLCYVLWISFIFAVIPVQGPYGLYHMATSTHPVSDLQYALSHALQMPWITQAINIFSSICIMTSFLANSISLTDFIADGFGHVRIMSALRGDKSKSIVVYLAAYIPPLIAVLFCPSAFLLGLSMAGVLAIILLLILPGLMVLRFRYRADNRQQYTLRSKLLLGTELVIAFGLLAWSIGGYIYAGI